MKIIELEVYNYKRLSLNPDMKHIVFRPKKKLILILGDNGAGKSSFLDLLCPRVIPAKDFNTGGYCRLTFELNGVTYKLVTENNKYQFIIIKDGSEENLNPAGGLRQQDMLLSKILNIDTKIQSLLTGATMFTRLGVAARREIMELLSGSDYRYISHVYTSSQSKLRDASAVIEYAQKQLVSHTSKLKELERQNKNVDVKIGTLNKEIKNLLCNVDTDTEHVKKNEVLHVLDDLSKVHHRLNLTHRQLMTTCSSYITLGNYHNVPKIKKVLEERITIIKTKKSILSKQHHELDNEITKGLDDSISYKDLKKRFNDTKKKLKSYKSKLPHNNRFKYDNPKKSFNTIKYVESLLCSMDDMDDVDYKQYLNGYIKDGELDAMHKRYSEITSEIKRYNELLEHHNHLEQSKLTCPRCKYTWSDTYDKKRHNEVKDKLKKLYAESRTLKTVMDAKIDFWERSKSAINAMERYHNLNHDVTSCILPLKNDIDKRLTTTPKGIRKLVIEHLSALNIMINIRNTEEELEKIRNQIDTYNGLSDNVLHEKEKKLKDIEDKIKRYGQIQVGIQKRLDKVEFIMKLIEKMESLFNRSHEIISKWDKTINNYTKGVKNEVIRTAVNNKSLEVNKLNLISNNIIRHKDKIKELKSTLDERIRYRNTCKKLVDITNPKGKLVARSILTFLNAFIDEMNDILERVWNYPLAIEPLSGDLESLTYRFRFKSGKSIRDDIAQASNATSDIINIAFKMVAMKCLNLDTFPLYLDELGEGYDDLHKMTLCKVVNDHLTKQNYSNIFVVAQVKEIYDYFSENTTDKIVLSNNNMPSNIKSSDALSCVLTGNK